MIILLGGYLEEIHLQRNYFNVNILEEIVELTFLKKYNLICNILYHYSLLFSSIFA